MSARFPLVAHAGVAAPNATTGSTAETPPSIADYARATLGIRTFPERYSSQNYVLVANRARADPCADCEA